MALAEIYLNRYGHPIGQVHHKRYWVHDKIMVGGNVNDAEDWKHLTSTYGIQSCINVDDISDEGKGIPFLVQSPFPDNGDQIPIATIRHLVSFAKLYIGLGPIYVHCHAGISRSPSIAYAIMRWVYDISSKDALAAIRMSGGIQSEIYGHQRKHRVYLECVERALRFSM